MEDIFKIIFYIVAVTLWIIYKAREQKKKNGFTPKEESEPAIEFMKPKPPKVGMEKKQALVVSEKVNRNKARQVSLNKIENVKIEENLISETYHSEYLNQILKEDESIENERVLSEKKMENIFVFDAKQAIIGSEIFKRPFW